MLQPSCLEGPGHVLPLLEEGMHCTRRIKQDCVMCRTTGKIDSIDEYDEMLDRWGRCLKQGLSWRHGYVGPALARAA